MKWICDSLNSFNVMNLISLKCFIVTACLLCLGIFDAETNLPISGYFLKRYKRPFIFPLFKEPVITIQIGCSRVCEYFEWCSVVMSQVMSSKMIILTYWKPQDLLNDFIFYQLRGFFSPEYLFMPISFVRLLKPLDFFFSMDLFPLNSWN